MIRSETRGDILGEGQLGRPVDLDVIVVVDPYEIVELEMPGERHRLGAYAF